MLFVPFTMESLLLDKFNISLVYQNINSSLLSKNDSCSDCYLNNSENIIYNYTNSSAEIDIFIFDVPPEGNISISA